MCSFFFYWILFCIWCKEEKETYRWAQSFSFFCTVKGYKIHEKIIPRTHSVRIEVWAIQITLWFALGRFTAVPQVYVWCTPWLRTDFFLEKVSKLVNFVFGDLISNCNHTVTKMLVSSCCDNSLGVVCLGQLVLVHSSWESNLLCKIWSTKVTCNWKMTITSFLFRHLASFV